MKKIVYNFAQALESARKTRSKKLICDCDQALHWKKRAKELAEMVLDFTCRNPKDPYTIRAWEILNESN